MELRVALQLHGPLGDDRRASVAAIGIGRVHDAAAVLPKRASKTSVVPAWRVPISATSCGRIIRTRLYSTALEWSLINERPG